MRAIKLLLFICILSASAFSQTMTVKLYFHNEIKDPEMLDCNKVYETERTIPKTKAVATAALNELFKGVTDEEKRKGFVTFPAEKTKGILKRVTVKKNIAYVNFKNVIYGQFGDLTTSCGGGYLASIEETLKQFSTIEKVVYAVEENPRDFYDWIQVGECPDEIKDCSGKYFDE